jgi:SAM-dependent methyltransferase
VRKFTEIRAVESTKRRLLDESILAEKIAAFPRWHYQFDLKGCKTPVSDESKINRHEQRKAYFFDPLVWLLGGTLEGHKVLDLGCNAGYWSLLAAQLGCDYVLGIDARQDHIDQANLVFEVKGIDRSRFSFRCGNVFDVLKEDVGSFDIVLCLGLFHHISKPMELLELISTINSDVLIIDTVFSPRQGPWLEVRRDSKEDPTNAYDHEVVFVPTREALLMMLEEFGYRAVILEPNFTDYRGAGGYLWGVRRALFCAKNRQLGALGEKARFRSGLRSMKLMRKIARRLRRHP